MDITKVWCMGCYTRVQRFTAKSDTEKQQTMISPGANFISLKEPSFGEKIKTNNAFPGQNTNLS